MDWDHYSLIETKDGNDVDLRHPSPYGYGKNCPIRCRPLAAGKSVPSLTQSARCRREIC